MGKRDWSIQEHCKTLLLVFSDRRLLPNGLRSSSYQSLLGDLEAHCLMQFQRYDSESKFDVHSILELFVD